MSSRALRKAQREKEEQEQLRKLQEEEPSDEEYHDDEGPVPVAKKSAFSAFAMLGDEDEEEDDEPEDAVPAVQPRQSSSDEEETQPRPTKTTKSKKKKKSKAKGGPKMSATPPADADLDDIDLALKSLSTKPSAKGSTANATSVDPTVAETCSLLSIDTSHLHASNEMRRLFGRAALERDNEEDEPAGGRRRRGQQQQGLAAALRGRQAAGGRTNGLAALSLRRNIFIQGKDEWPVATSGGLGMEIVDKTPDGTVEYRYTHTRPYQSVQSEFDTCVASMDPNRMVQLLQYNPYHISTLLQVSEIAKQERDHATSGDLLERALFSFGRSVHSTFSHNLSQGKARMDFRRPENREFWLAACRYISNLGMRSTWRTVYEWAKLLLSLDPENDPYCMSLVLDQYAIRARSPQNFLDIANSAFFSTKWRQLANIQLSKGLAFVQTGQDGKGKQALFGAVTKFPHVVARLLQELSIDAPPAIWGKQPRTDSEKLHGELYATRAKDLWNTPEASNLLAEVSSAVLAGSEPPIVDQEITLNEARHVIMSDIPALISNLPRSITTKVTSSSDPLPPPDNLSSYTVTSNTSTSRPARISSTADNLRELDGLYRFFSGIFPWFHRDGQAQETEQPNPEEVERHLRDSGVSEDLIMQRTQRLLELQTLLAASGEADVVQRSNEADDGDEEIAALAEARQAHVQDAEDEED